MTVPVVVEALHPTLREYLLILDRVPEVFRRSWDAIAVYDLEGRLMAGNAAARALVGAPLATTFLGEHFTIHHTPDAERRAARAFARCITTRKAVEGDSVFRDAAGLPVPVRVRLVPAHLDGAIVGVVGFARGLRDLRIAESDVLVAEQQFRSLFEHHPDALAIHDLEGRFVRVNASLTALTGYASADLIGRTPDVMAGGSGGDLGRVLAGVKRGETVEFECVLRTKNGELLDIAGIALPLVADGELRGYCGISRDMTGERRRERESARAAKRIDDLYQIAAASSMSSEDKVNSALDRARVELDAKWAYVGRVRDGAIELTHVSGDPHAGFEVGFTKPIERTIARYVIEANDAFTVPDLSRAPYRANLDERSAGWRSFIGVPLTVNGERYGAIGFLAGSRSVRFSPSDRDYVRAIGALIGSAVQQGVREKRLDTLAFHDALTGLPNRALVTDRLERARLAARRNHRSFAVHYLDLDHFKNVNDSYGHHVGDGLLVAVANWLQSHLRDSDTVGRIGGDEFVVLQPEVGSIREVEDVAARLVTIRDQPFRVGEHEIRVRLSIGVAVYSADGADPVDMLRAADAQLYTVKNAGRDGYAVRTV